MSDHVLTCDRSFRSSLFYAWCSCGWRSSPWLSLESADNAGRHHVEFEQINERLSGMEVPDALLKALGIELPDGSIIRDTTAEHVSEKHTWPAWLYDDEAWTPQPPPDVNEVPDSDPEGYTTEAGLDQGHAYLIDVLRQSKCAFVCALKPDGDIVHGAYSEKGSVTRHGHPALPWVLMIATKNADRIGRQIMREAMQQFEEPDESA